MTPGHHRTSNILFTNLVKHSKWLRQWFPIFLRGLYTFFPFPSQRVLDGCYFMYKKRYMGFGYSLTAECLPGMWEAMDSITSPAETHVRTTHTQTHPHPHTFLFTITQPLSQTLVFPEVVSISHSL